MRGLLPESKRRNKSPRNLSLSFVMSEKFFMVGNECYSYDSQTNRIATLDRTAEPLCRDEYCAEGELAAVTWRKTFSELVYDSVHCLSSLVLQTTRACNLRCEYCAYSGNFKQMKPHSNESMTFDVMRSSIDFFMKNSTESTDLMIIFYGGEPLLEFMNIQNAVKYAKSFGRRIRFGISSNGTLLSPHIIDWLNRTPDVYLTVTLNGEQHDIYRLDSEGNGTREAIMKNVSAIRYAYPKLWEERIRFIANFNSYGELYELRDFFKSNLGRIPDTLTRINIDYANSEISKKFAVNEDFEEKARDKLIREYIQEPDEFLDLMFSAGLNAIHNRGLYKEDTPIFIGSCMPMSWRLFVRADGTFNICERASDHITLGDIDSGYDYNIIKELYYSMRSFARRNCRTCWAQRLCMYCYQDTLNSEGKMLETFTANECYNRRKHILDLIKVYIQVMLKYPEKLT